MADTFVVPATQLEVDRLRGEATSDLGRRPMPEVGPTLGPTVWLTGTERHRWALVALVAYRRADGVL